MPNADSQLITKPDANPVLAGFLNVALLGVPLGYLMIGQRRKFWIGWLAVWLLMPCGGIGWFAAIVLAYDAYLLAQKLASGQSIEAGEVALDWLRNAPGFRR